MPTLNFRNLKPTERQNKDISFKVLFYLNQTKFENTKLYGVPLKHEQSKQRHCIALVETCFWYVPMKSIISRPSENRPAGAWKKVSPLGKGACPKAADSPPVSEFESPKLKMAGKLQGPEEPLRHWSNNVIENMRPMTTYFKV